MASAMSLSASGAIDYRDGRISLLDCDPLEETGCECQQVVKRGCQAVAVKDLGGRSRGRGRDGGCRQTGLLGHQQRRAAAEPWQQRDGTHEEDGPLHHGPWRCQRLARSLP